MTRFLALLFTCALATPLFAAGDHLEFIYETAPFPSCHAATIEEAADGTLVSAWFGGTDEGENDVGIWVSLKPKGADQWSVPVEIYNEPTQPAWNPVLYRDPENVIWLWFKVGPSPREWSGVWVKSTDNGQSWGEPYWLPSGLLGPIRNKPILLENGSLLAGTSFESYETWATWMELSEDGGKSWKKIGPLAFDDMEMNRKGTIQPTMLEVEPGHIVALMRTRGLGKVGRSESLDSGLTWSPVTLTDLPHPGSGIDAVRLDDGRCVLIYNPVERGRNPLSLAISYDNAKTWTAWMDIEKLEVGQLGELSYPNIIQASNGDLHMVYTWRRERIRHAQIPLNDIPKQ